MMKKLVSLPAVICAALLLLCACSSGKAPEKASVPASSQTQELKVRESSDYPLSIRYERTSADNGFEKAKTGDQYTMDDVLEAIDWLEIKEETTVDADATTDVLIFVGRDGSEERVEFCGGALLKDGTYYRTEGFEDLQKVLDKMMETYGGLEHPYGFTAKSLQDDRDGLYWIFYEGGYGARFTGFDGTWFIGEQFFTWGVDEGILYIFPVDGEEEQYPVTFGDSVDDGTIDLGEIRLNEVFPKELTELYNHWVPIGKQIREKMEETN